MMEGEELRAAVWLSLNIAAGNGYLFEGWSLEEMAADLIRYDANFATIEDPALLHPDIQSWRDKQG